MGLAFKWKYPLVENSKTIQIIFRSTGLDLTRSELNMFAKQIDASLENPKLCGDCKLKESCKSILLPSPAPQVSFAMSFLELQQMQDLLTGTLFQLNVEGWVQSI